MVNIYAMQVLQMPKTLFTNNINEIDCIVKKYDKRMKLFQMLRN